jgi:hypothetical protein
MRGKYGNRERNQPGRGKEGQCKGQESVRERSATAATAREAAGDRREWSGWGKKADGHDTDVGQRWARGGI